MPYSDIPDGATVVSDPGQYSDLPPGSTITYHPPVGQDWQSQVKPVPTFNGKQSVQRSDGAVWYGPDQGNTRNAGWFDAKGNRAGDAPGQAPRDSWAGRALSALGNAAQVQQSAPGLSGITPEASQLAATSLTGPAQQAARFYSHVAPNWAGAQGAGNLVNQIQANKQQIIAQDPSGASAMTSGLGDIATQVGLSELMGLPGIAGKLGSMGAAAGSGWLAAAFNGARSAAISSGLFGVQNALTNPSGVDASDRSIGGLPSYMGQGAVETANQGTIGALIGFGLGAIPGIATGIGKGKDAISDAVRNAMIGSTPQLPPEVASGETVNDIMKSAGQRFEGLTIPDIQRVSQGTGEDAAAAKSIIQRLTVADGLEHGIDHSLHDVSADPAGRSLEASVRDNPKVAAFRNQQGAQIRQAMMNTQDKYEAIAQSTPFDSQKPSSGTIPTDRPLDMVNDDIHSMTPSVDEAAAAGDAGANHVKSLMDGVGDDNNKMIQASLQGEYWKNRQIGNAIRNSIDDHIDRVLAADPSAAGTRINEFGTQSPVTSFDARPALDEIKTRIAEDGQTHPDIEGLLNGYATKLQDPANLSYRGGKALVSQMENQAEELKAAGKFGDARDLFLVKRQIDNASDNFAQQILKNDPVGLESLGQDSEWFKKNVLPYQDPLGGIDEMMHGVDADIATKPLFRDSSSNQFDRMFSLLDEKGKAAVRAEMVGHTGDTRMKNFQDMNIPASAAYMENHSDQIATAFGDDHTLPALDNTIRNSPGAGYQSNLKQGLAGSKITEAADTFYGDIKKTTKSLVNIPLNNYRYSKLFEPNLADYAGPTTPTATTALGYGLPTLNDGSAAPSKPPLALPQSRALGMYPRGESTGLVTRGMAQLPEYHPPIPLGGPTAINPQTPTLPPYAQSLGQLNGPVYPPAQRMPIKIIPKGPMGIAQPTNATEYLALPSGTPYRSISGAYGVKP